MFNIGMTGEIAESDNIRPYVKWDNFKGKGNCNCGDGTYSTWSAPISNLRKIPAEIPYTKGDLNTAMLFKIRGYGLAYGNIEDGKMALRDKAYLNLDCTIDKAFPDNHSDNLLSTVSKSFDIIAIKQLKNQLDAYNAVQSNTEPSDWDWTREDKPEPKPVDFMEAVRAKKIQGGKIKCVCEDKEYIYSDDWHMRNERGVSISIKEITDGTWFILPKEDNQ